MFANVNVTNSSSSGYYIHSRTTTTPGLLANGSPTSNADASVGIANIDEDDEAESKLLLRRYRCQLCNTSMDAYLVDSTRKLHVCGNNPDCDGFLIENDGFFIGKNAQFLSTQFSRKSELGPPNGLF